MAEYKIARGKGRPKDLTGHRTGRLAIQYRLPERISGRIVWRCICDCGNACQVTSNQLLHKTKPTRSCGCLKLDVLRTHGGSGTSEFSAFQNMHQRCSNQKSPRFAGWGGRGISVCERWQTFENFIADMGPKPSPALTLERIDNDGNYEPGNCEWATRKKQQRNMSRNHVLTFNGESHALATWADRIGMPVKTLESRIKRHWTVERAFTQPVQAMTRSRSGKLRSRDTGSS